MTSLTFMLVWVPDPVCQTTSGKWSSSPPEATSAGRRDDSQPPISPSENDPISALTLAATFLTRAKRSE